MTGHWRGVGITELMAWAASEPLVLLFAILTQLGDVWFLVLLGCVLYVFGDHFPRWGIDRRRALFVLGLLITYVALIGFLKETFLLPRPPGAGDPPAITWIPPALQGVLGTVATPSGQGFPSGHALGTTLVWGGLALVVGEKPSRSSLGVAGVVVLVVSFSRLVLGVHYLVDVVAGVLLGTVVLAVLYAISDRGTDPSPVLLGAVAIGALGLLPGITFASVTAVGSAIGGLIAWRTVADSTPAHPTNRREVLAGMVLLGLAGGLFGVVYALEPSLPLAFAGSALAFALVVATPRVSEALTD